MLSSLVFIAALTQAGSSPGGVAQQAQEDLRLGKYSLACQELEKGRSQLKELDPAIEAFERVISIDPRHAPAYFNLGLLYGYKGQPDKSLEMHRRGLKIDPGDLDANQNYAFLLIRLQRYEEAIVPLQKLKAAHWSDLSVRSALVECLGKSGRKSEAAKEIKDFLKLPGASETDKFNLAGVLVVDGDLDSAQVALEYVVAELPQSAEAHGKLGLVLSKKNQFEEASRQLRTAVELAPDSPEYAIGYAEALLLWGQSPAALEFLMSVKNRFGTLPDFQYKVALSYYGLHEYPQAISVLEELGRQHPEYDLVQFFLGNSYMAAGDLDKAEGYYRKAIELNPTRSVNYSPLAQLLRKRGGASTDEAIRLLHTALKLDPTDLQSKLEVALCYEEKKSLQESQALLEDVVRAQPDFYQAHVALARVDYHLRKKQEGDRERAIVARIENEKRAEQTKLRQTLPSPKQ